MLVAELRGQRVDADSAARGENYACPECKAPLTFKRGRIVIPHFAHKPPIDCTWAAGETIAHLEAKKLIQSIFRGRGLRAETEFVINTIGGKSRADVAIWSPAGQLVVVEMQHSSISLEEIERRAFIYAESNICQIWVPFLNKRCLELSVKTDDNHYLVERYTARPFERWIQALNFGKGPWMYDPTNKSMYCAFLDKCIILPLHKLQAA